MVELHDFYEHRFTTFARTEHDPFDVHVELQHNRAP